MAQPTSLVWPRDPHTEAKHNILRGYLDAYFPIMINHGFDRVTYAEGFAGPGEYLNGEPGSPVIALEAALARPEVATAIYRLRFAFVEENRPRYERLREIVNARWPQADRPAQLIRGACGDCRDQLALTLEKSGSWGQPIFANLDAWNTDIPLPLVRRFASNQASEVMVTLTTDYFTRFANQPDLPGDDVFGNANWREVVHQDSASKTRFVVECYRQALRDAGFQFTLVFELVDEGGRAVHIFHGSNHPRALERMKDSMWKVDPIRGTRFRDPRDPSQGTLDLGPDAPLLAPLKRMLLTEISHRGRCSVDALRDYALFETMYRPTHAQQAVRELVKDVVLDRDPAKGQVTRNTIVWSRL